MRYFPRLTEETVLLFCLINLTENILFKTLYANLVSSILPLFIFAGDLQIKKALRGVKVEVTHRGNMRRKYRISGLTSQTTRELTYECFIYLLFTN